MNRYQYKRLKKGDVILHERRRYEVRRRDEKGGFVVCSEPDGHIVYFLYHLCDLITPIN